MKKIVYIFVAIIFLIFAISSCGKKDNCANCKGYIAVGEVAVIVWSLDSFVKYFPNNRESDWCKLLDGIDGKPLVVNGQTLGTLNKSCE